MTDQLEFMRRRLQALERRHLLRQTRVVQNGADAWLHLDGRRLLNLSSNNYLGLALHPEVVAAAGSGEAAGSGSARLIAGTSPLHQELENRLAAFKGTEAALLFNSGFTANTSVIPALVGPGDTVLGDALNHASLIDGCRLSQADFRTYRHANVEELGTLLQTTPARGRTLVVTDTVFSMDGDVAPLIDIVELCDEYGALLLVDEAHATGCLGPGGRGLVAATGVEDRVTVIMGTLGKALGSFGAFVAGPQLVMTYLLNIARGFIFSTSLPPGVVAASLAALTVLEREPVRSVQLQLNAERFRRGLGEQGFDTLNSETQIVPILVGESALALEMAAHLREEDVFAVAVRPPTVPMGQARLRMSLMATHTEEDIDFALHAVERVSH